MLVQEIVKVFSENGCSSKETYFLKERFSRYHT
jgi:hypothetical protein